MREKKLRKTEKQIRTMPQILKLLRKDPRIVYIAATDVRYGGEMAVEDGIREVDTEQFFLDVKTPLSEWTNGSGISAPIW